MDYSAVELAYRKFQKSFRRYQSKVTPYLILTFVFLASSTQVHAIGTQQFVDFSAKNGLVLAGPEGVAPIIVDKSEFPGVLRAARDLQRDIASVTGKTPQWYLTPPKSASDMIIAGTLGRRLST